MAERVPFCPAFRDEEVKELKKNFEPTKPVPRKRQPKKRSLQTRRAVSAEMAKRIYEMRFNLQYSFQKIGKILYCAPSTACTALKRLLRSEGELIDRRRFNGRNNRRLKIVPRISRHLLDQKVLQRWGFMGLQQRCLQLEKDCDVSIKPQTLREFYIKHNIKNRVVGFRYQQAQNRSELPLMTFSLYLARLIQEKKPLVYFDESSFHMWMRSTRTWTYPDCAVKWAYPKFRGSGITVFGAISTSFERPVFMQAPATNRASVVKFLGLLRKEFRDPDEKVFVVLDNHTSHHTKEVTELAKNLNFEFMFMPPYSPELNSIEALWGIVKRKVKKTLIDFKLVTLTQNHFETILQECLDSVSSEVQQAAAQHNNRGFVLKCLENILAGEPAKIESLSVSSISEASIGQIEMTEGLPFEEEAPFELNNPSAFHYELP